MTKQQKYLFEGVVQDLVPLIMDKQNLALTEALGLLYNSETFLKLQDVQTGLYQESAGFVHELLCDELTCGKFTQVEQ